MEAYRLAAIPSTVSGELDQKWEAKMHAASQDPLTTVPYPQGRLVNPLLRVTTSFITDYLGAGMEHSRCTSFSQKV